MLISPIVLVSLVVIFFFFPNILSYSIIEPAAASIMPTLLDGDEKFKVHIYMWHGFSTELYMTIGVVALGVLAYLTLSKWRKVYGLFPETLTLNKLYDSSLSGLEKGSNKITRTYMTGFLRDYLVYVFVFFIVIIGGSLAVTGGFSYDVKGNASIGVYELVLSAVMIAATFTTVFARSRLTAIIGLGVIGYTLALFFVIFRAPDLALTQLIIETISVALFLLCFYHLPKLRFKPKTARFRVTNALVSVGVGTIVTLLALSANSQRSLESIASYFIENSYKLAGGHNIVNVILVDFRGFDTLFEITVLVIAALGIYGMIRLRLEKGGEEH